MINGKDTVIKHVIGIVDTNRNNARNTHLSRAIPDLLQPPQHFTDIMLAETTLHFSQLVSHIRLILLHNTAEGPDSPSS